jgi:mannose-6-phosphate isomerase-like protein (cupin superfamily)
MAQQAARTPGATRAGDGDYVFDLAKVNHILGGPDYSTANGACVEGDRMIVGLMRMPAGTGAEPHSHPNEQWIYILEGTFRARIGDKEIEAKPGSVVYVPSNAFRRSHARGRRRVLHLQGRLAQPARDQVVGGGREGAHCSRTIASPEQRQDCAPDRLFRPPMLG